MRDWIKRSNSKKLNDCDVIHSCSEEQLPSSGDTTRADAFVTGNGNYLSNILKSFRGQRRSKTEVEANPFTLEIESHEKVSTETECKIDLEQILERIEMKVSTQRYVASSGLTGCLLSPNVSENTNEEGKAGLQTPKEVKFADEYSNVFQPEEDEGGSEEDPVYSSRKLLMRQLINNELQEIESRMDEDRLSTDSWSEMEESFTKIYEPLPPPIEFASKARPSKEELLQSIPDKRLRAELGYLELPDIIFYLKNLNKAHSTVRPRPLSSRSEKFMVDVEVHEIETASELWLTKPKRTPERIHEEIESDSLSWKSISINSDETEEEPFYVSRSEILARTQPPLIYAPERGEHPFSSSFVSEVVNLPFTPVSRSAIIMNGRRKEFKGGDFNEARSSNSLDSWSLDDYELPDDESMVGDRTIRCIDKDSGQRELLVEETEVGQQVKKDPEVSGNYINREHVSRSQILSSRGFNCAKKPLPALELRDRVQKFLALHPCVGRPTKEKVMLILKDHIEQSSNVRDTTEAESINQEVRDRLKEAFANDWENMSNVSLGFIYVPMEENAKLLKAPFEPSDYDTFGSIDSLIFEPKSLSSSKSAINGDEPPFSSLLESLSSSFVPEDEQLLNCASSPPSIDLRQQRQVTHCLHSSASSEGLSHPYSAAEEGGSSRGLPELSDRLKNVEFFNYFADSSPISLISPFGSENLRVFENDEKKISPYHPDHIKRTSCRDPIFDSFSSPDESGSVSDTESVTSVDSVIVNMKAKLPENNNNYNNVKRPTSKKKYIVNRGHESDSNSDIDGNSTQQTQLVDIDTSWDYIATPNGESTNAEGFSSYNNINDRPNDNPANFRDHSQFADYLANSQFHSTLAKEIHMEDVANAQYESSEDTPKATAENNIYEGPPASVVLLKHHVYQSIESLQSLLSSSEAEFYSPSHLESIPGASSCGPHSDEAPLFLSINDELVKLNEDRNKDHSVINSITSHPQHPNVGASLSSGAVRVNQKKGDPLLVGGTGKNDLMIQELKLKLRQKFLPEGDEEESLLKSKESLDFASVVVSKDSIDCKRKQLAPLIFKSIHLHGSESLSTETEKVSACDLINEPESLAVEEMSIEPVFFDASDSSLVWVPTPDYTPLSTLPKNFQREECLLLPFPDLEDFVRNHLIKAQSENKFSDSALATEESRARRARSRSPKRSVRFDTSRKLPELTLGATWSDLESVIFAEDKSVVAYCDETGRPDSRLTNSQASCKLPCTRMESYKDEWLLWDQLAKMRRSRTPEDRERWQSEKTKRMLLWVHLSNNNSHIEWCYKSHWWKAKQRASVAWIVQKCHKNKVPSDFEDPYYKDYEGLEHLKPGIVHRLSNADMYCSALANIYGDPNFHNLSHWNIIQALARKGVYVAEPTDVALTETVLIQTTPIKMSAHLAVIEAMMALYIREVVVAKRVVQAIQRISGISQAQDIPTPQDQEEALVLWVDHSTQALQSRIHQQVQQTQDQELPVFPKIQDLSDLSDGIGLAALLAFYCPQELSWGDIAVADPPSMADSLYNIGLVIKFCKDSLPYNPCLLTKEDIVYMHSSVKQNILAFVAELFFLMELEPVSCVSFSNTRKTSSKYIQLSSPGMRPAGVPSVRRSHSMNLNDASDSRSRAESRSENAPSSHNSDYGGRDSSMSDGQDSEFLVQKAKGYATLNDMMRNHSPHPSQHDNPPDIFGSKEKYNTESKDEELGERGKLNRRGSFYGSINDLNELPPAGIPTRLENRPIGRSRSRRNSINADESQLTIENFGGSQDNLNYISRNPDKEPYIHTGKKESFQETFPRRSASQNRDTDKSNDHTRSSLDELDNRVMDKLERDALEREKRDSHYSSKEALQRKDHRRRSQPAERVESSSESEASYEAEKPIGKATSFAELSKLKEQLPGGINIIYMQQPEKEDTKTHHSKGSEKKTTTFAALPNQTTWKQQSFQNQVDSDGADDNYEPQVVTSELHNVRLKLEEKRRRIEAEKRKMELMLNKQRQKLGKEAFMQAVVKGDLGTEVSNVSKKWLANEGPKEDLRTPDMDAMDYDEYQKSLSQMTDSLTEIQSDIQRLSHQQHQIQTLMKNGMVTQPNQFYLHDQQGSPARRMWSQPSSSDGYSSMSPATRRAQWGPPARPIIPQGEYLIGGSQQPASYYSYQTSPNMNQPHQLPPMNQLGQPPPQSNQGGFLLHGQPHSLPAGHQPNSVYQNGQTYYPPDYFRGYQAPNYIVDPSRGPLPSQGGSAPFRLHQDGGGGDESRGSSSLRSSAHSSPSHQTYQRFQKSPSPSRQVSHAPVAAPPPDDMEPQNVCFIEEQKQNQSDVSDKLKNLSISSGSRTYRISHEPGSPTRPPIGTKTFRVPTKRGTPVYDDADLPQPSPPQRSLSPPYNSKNDTDNLSSLVHVEPLVEGPKADKGFYISLDDEGPKRPKPPLRLKKLSQKKSSGSLALLTTPTREEAPSIYQDHDKENKSDLRSPSSYNSLKYLRSSSRGLNADTPSPVYHNTSTSHFSTRSDQTLSPSSASSVLRDSSPSSIWNYQTESKSRPNSHINKLNNSRFSYGDLQDDGSNSDSDFANEGSVRVHKRSDPKSPHHGTALVIGDDLVNEDSSLSEMEKKKEKLMMMSIRRKQQQEEMKRKKEIEADLKREEEKKKEEDRLRKKEEEKARRELILEKHKIKKAIEEAEKEGRYYVPPAWYYEESSATSTPNNKSSVRLRNRGPGGSKPRPKTMHEASFSGSDERLSGSRGKKGSSHNISESSANTRKINGRWGSSGSLSRAVGNRGSTGSLGPDYSSSSLSRGVAQTHSGRRPTSVIGDTGSLVRRERSKGSLYGSRGMGLNERDQDPYQVHENRRPSVASTRRSRLPCYDGVTGRKYRSTGSLYGPGDHDSLVYHVSEDSGLGRATPPRRAPSPGMSSRHLPSPSGPGSLPPGLFSRRRPGVFDDNMSDISTTSSNMDYCGPRLFKQPTAKSNRNIILNAVEYCVFPGVVNQTSKHRVLEEVGRSEAKHFLILFRDSGCQFRALYSYNPDLEEVFKLYGTGPKQVTDRMFEKFFKYNSGGKCFSQIHTKHLTVTIDAFTIHNSLWQGKKVNLPSKKDMKLVI